MQKLVQDKDFMLLLMCIKDKIGVDFSQYRLTSLKRRIDNRLKINNLSHYREYIQFLNQNPTELVALAKLVTINLTAFFRDKPAWKVVEQQVMPAIIEKKIMKKQHHIKVWSAGTSSGEEAYTLAILFHKILGDQIKQFNLKIYGTDIDEASLKKANAGCYPTKSMQYMPASILQKYFIADETGYEVHETLRKVTEFKYHDLVASEMYMSMDFIVCRNVLIYFNRELQSLILEKFHRTLHQEGFLMLGKTESMIYQTKPDFLIYDSRERIYQKLKS